MLYINLSMRSGFLVATTQQQAGPLDKCSARVENNYDYHNLIVFTCTASAGVLYRTYTCRNMGKLPYVGGQTLPEKLVQAEINLKGV